MFQKLVLNMVETANDKEPELVKKHHLEMPNLGLDVDPIDTAISFPIVPL